MPPHGSHVSSSRNLQRRREIAALAARLMAEDGISDFGFAKRKAARQLGASEDDALPANTEIETELRAWQALYQGKEQASRLAAMRTAAAGLMRALARFRPYLCGSVLDGTAGRYAEIEIDLYPESAKDVEIFFLDAALDFAHREVRRALSGAPEMALALEWDDIPVRLHIYPANAERNTSRQSRAHLAQVESLLAGEAS
ncbi:MAG: hypothetical protein LBB76_09945 [Azoarcus sp.]|jgi:hypothetical protein|nr:hypothetical protein [Azoarcus sp.]